MLNTSAGFKLSCFKAFYDGKRMFVCKDLWSQTNIRRCRE